MGLLFLGESHASDGSEGVQGELGERSCPHGRQISMAEHVWLKNSVNRKNIMGVAPTHRAHALERLKISSSFWGEGLLVTIPPRTTRLSALPALQRE